MSANMRATIQPATVQPRRKFSQKIALAFLFFRPTNAGRKYRRHGMMRNRSQWKGDNSPIALDLQCESGVEALESGFYHAR